ncbi:MAG TPA: short-chain dehydrogenase [Marinobacter adhaerens]|nr:short-chain dehydrogenase [Marinobacter adhaerens]
MTILITGANRGIGKGLADEWREAGEHVIGTARSEPGMEVLDVADPASVTALGERLENQPISTLVCNAGILLDRHEQLEGGYPPELWAEHFQVNVTGVFLTIQALLPNIRLALAGGGTPKIAIISSKLGSQASAGGGRYIYRASKAAALNLGRNLAVDLREQGIAVGIYHPGWVATDMGGSDAEVSVEQSVDGLRRQIDSLTLAETGCFKAWDGKDMAF